MWAFIRKWAFLDHLRYVVTTTGIHFKSGIVIEKRLNNNVVWSWGVWSNSTTA